MILTMSLAPVGILIRVVFLVLVAVVSAIAVSNVPPDIENQASLTLVARSGYINKIALTVTCPPLSNDACQCGP